MQTPSAISVPLFVFFTRRARSALLSVLEGLGCNSDGGRRCTRSLLVRSPFIACDLHRLLGEICEVLRSGASGSEAERRLTYHGSSGTIGFSTVELCDENTVCVCAILESTYAIEFEDVTS